MDSFDAAVGMATGGGGAGAAPPLRILFMLGILSLLPAIVLSATSFVRTVVVLSFVRQGIGTQQTPPTQVIVGLALFMTAFTMSPIAQDIQQNALAPYQQGKVTDIQALEPRDRAGEDVHAPSDA